MEEFLYEIAFKKRLCFLFLFVLVFGLTACGSRNTEQVEDNNEVKSNEVESDEQVVIKIADYLPTSHLISIHATLPWIDRIEELGEGKIKVEYYPAEQLGKINSQFDNLKNKVSDIAYIQPERIEGVLPLTNVGANLGIVKDAVSGSRAFSKLVHEDLYESEFKAHGVRPLWAAVSSSNQIVNSKHPVKTIEDFKGLKVRTSNGMQEQLMSEWGATPITMSGGELYSSWERGIVDGSLFAFLNWSAYQLETIVEYSTVNAAVGRGIIMFGVNEEVWDSWPKDVQEAVRQASEEIAERFPKDIAEYEEKQIMQYKEETNIEFYEIPEDELQRWNEKFQSYNNNWAENLDRKGLPGTEILEKFTQYNEEFSE
ncbi:TRAP transporter substrate-binding protein DctP [Psychrobacillus sp. OK032]|uniref:TRAP transporter substrate-binding protein DctP n=1 Tax=Psychrobacillus sp. OK032 TaxID=1884358 RepID=UPI0008ADA63E|nr:TRAP transporter substrate-binding protein DctP [Psychrobacillus sp. OK032]SER82535.1 TRAP-type C4-dicarboxylate transport system, substrate-binding protein [Psychrobacillus sp. OK032]